jgi:hypothetical protein
MIYERFAVDYATRCLELLDMLEPLTKQTERLASCSLLAAATVFVIPYERMNAKNSMFRPRDGSLNVALKGLKLGKFLTAPFWAEKPPTMNVWRMSRVVSDINEPAKWRDEDGNHPMSPTATNRIGDKAPEAVLRVVRNALSHGNIVYLNEDGFETKNTPVRYLGFISNYDESRTTPIADRTYRLVVTTEEDFIHFVKAWATWVSGFPAEGNLSLAA